MSVENSHVCQSYRLAESAIRRREFRGRNSQRARAVDGFPPEKARPVSCSFFGVMAFSPARKRTLALQARALQFSTNVNQSYPDGALTLPSQIVWGQLVRAADGTSNNLIEADNGSSDADFLNKMRTAQRAVRMRSSSSPRRRISSPYFAQSPAFCASSARW